MLITFQGFKISKASKVQNLYLLIKFNTQAGLEAILDIPPLNIIIKSIAVHTIFQGVRRSKVRSRLACYFFEEDKQFSFSLRVFGS